MKRTRSYQVTDRHPRETANGPDNRAGRRPYGADGHYSAGIGSQPEHVPDYYRYGDSPTRQREGRSYEGAPSGYQNRFVRENRYGYYGEDYRPGPQSNENVRRGSITDRESGSYEAPHHRHNRYYEPESNYGYNDRDDYNDFGLSDNLAGYYGRSYEDDRDLWPDQRRELPDDLW